MNWNAIGDALLVMLQAVILAVVPLITKFITDFLQAKRVSLEANTVHESLRNIINTVGTLAEQSVAYVSQTYVDNLKKEGKFNAEEQEIAMRKAVSRLEQMVDEESQEVLRSVFGNLAIYFETLIEAAVRDQNQPPLVVIEEPTEGQV